MNVNVQIKKLHEDAKIPNQPYDGDAGFDLYANEEVTLAPMERTAIKTGLAIALPKGYAALIWDKSGIAIKKGQRTLGGVVDSGYRGEYMVGMINLTKESFTFAKGDKVAQVLIQKVEQISIIEADELDSTDRGEKGFGSSGK